MKAGSVLQVQLECRTRLRVFCYPKMLPHEQDAEEVSQEAEGLKDSPELSPTLATTARSLHRSLASAQFQKWDSQTQQQPAPGP